MAVNPLPPGLEEAIARMQVTRDRLAAKRGQRQIAPNMARAAVAPVPPLPRTSSKPGPERVNRPIQVRQAVNIWWNWD